MFCLGGLTLFGFLELGRDHSPWVLWLQASVTCQAGEYFFKETAPVFPGLAPGEILAVI